jgi:hypothetical protein
LLSPLPRYPPILRSSIFNSSRADQMKVFVGFASGLLLVFLTLTFWPRPVAERLASLRGDGRHLAAVYERIVRDPTPIDVAFIGTSHTLNGIDDRGVEEGLATAGIHANVANLGATWMGRDLHLFLTKALLAAKRPRLVVLEINEHEPPYGHPLLPYVATAPDMFCCRFLTEVNFPRMYLLFLKEQLYGALSSFAASSPAATNSPIPWKYGWSPLDYDWAQQKPHELSLGERIETLIGNQARGAAYELTSDFGRQTVRQIVELLKSNNVKVVFLYLPEFAFAAEVENENLRFYGQLAPVIMPPGDLVSNRLNWADSSHLNRAGAVQLVSYMSRRIAAVLVDSGRENQRSQWRQSRVFNSSGAN